MYLLQFYFFKRKSTFVNNSIIVQSNMKELFFYFRTSLRFFSKKTLKNIPLLQIIFEITSKNTFSNYKKKYKNDFLIKTVLIYFNKFSC